MSEFDLQLDYYQLLNLHKALLEAKFHTNPDNELVSASPLVASVYIQVRNLLLRSGRSEQWEEWFQLKNRPEYRRRAILRLLKSKRWSKASPKERRKIMEDHLAPFIYSEEELCQALSDAEAASQPVPDPAAE